MGKLERERELERVPDRKSLARRLTNTRLVIALLFMASRDGNGEEWEYARSKRDRNEGNRLARGQRPK